MRNGKKEELIKLHEVDLVDLAQGRKWRNRWKASSRLCIAGTKLDH